MDKHITKSAYGEGNASGPNQFANDVQFRVYDVEEMEQAATGLAGILNILENDDVER